MFVAGKTGERLYDPIGDRQHEVAGCKAEVKVCRRPINMAYDMSCQAKVKPCLQIVKAGRQTIRETSRL
jgi:hypothetical protein